MYPSYGIVVQSSFPIHTGLRKTTKTKSILVNIMSIAFLSSHTEELRLKKSFK